MSKISVFTDGGARGNPGPAGIGVYIFGEKGDIAKIGERIGEATNNVAEYSAIVRGLRFLVENKGKIEDFSEVNFFLDSQLATFQLNGIYKIKNSNLRNLLFEIRQFEAELAVPVTYSHIPREKNKMADKLVNMALDRKI